MQMREPREMRCPAWLDPRHSLARQGKGCDMEGCLSWGEVTLMSSLPAKHLTNQSQHTEDKMIKMTILAQNIITL